YGHIGQVAQRQAVAVLDRKAPKKTGSSFGRPPDGQFPYLSTVATAGTYSHCRYMATMTQIAKWGNSLGLRLPKSVALEAQVDAGDTVDVSVKNGAIVIRPSRPTLPRAFGCEDYATQSTRRGRLEQAGGP